MPILGILASAITGHLSVPITVDYLVIAGGGGGASGGGGAGGYRSSVTGENSGGEFGPRRTA